jgi:hypothetical protein
MMVHEGSHGVDQRRDGMTSSRTTLTEGDIRAYTAEALFYQAAGHDPYQFLLPNGRIDTQAINDAAAQSVEGSCRKGGCTP